MTGKPTEEFESRPQGTQNVHPECPKPNIPDNMALDKWSGLDRSDYCTQRFTYSHISKERWEEIFGCQHT